MKEDYTIIYHLKDFWHSLKLLIHTLLLLKQHLIFLDQIKILFRHFSYFLRKIIL